MTALTLLVAMKAKGAGPSIIAHELALDLGAAAFRPDVATHRGPTFRYLQPSISRLCFVVYSIVPCFYSNN